MTPLAPDRFLGRWQLLPELCLYEFGSVLVSGEYRISREDRIIRIIMEWTMADGIKQTATFGARDDGSWRPDEGPGAETYTLTRIDQNTLDSAAFRAGASIGYARRVASNDGTLLVVVQDGARENGEKFRNFQVYRRVAER